ncbi:HAD-IA family hydrolase [Amycolatopsis thermoflava]|uniref:Sugar-phosphatase n=1 Tax=Amycolatopsis thermoflava TaxID=84480 RepID=A0A3N2H757_9PSEU|nr:HAD-IA family hydrolase [Amycolatopsis thermoflava]ROS43965.1 sugar-phosphatase [Amycolatopsis thermoflava]
MDDNELVLLVDMDGTLVDSDEAQVRSWTAWAAGHRLNPGPFLDAQGRTARDKITEFAPWLDVESETRRIAAMEAEERSGVRALPGALDLWRSNQRFAVVTSADEKLARVRLDAAGLDVRRPETIVTADDVTKGKPDPEPYLLAARRLGVDPARCTVVEDAPAGVEAGLAAGMEVVALTTTAHERDVAFAHIVVRTLDELLLTHSDTIRKVAL